MNFKNAKKIYFIKTSNKAIEKKSAKIFLIPLWKFINFVKTNSIK